MLSLLYSYSYDGFTPLIVRHDVRLKNGRFTASVWEPLLGLLYLSLDWMDPSSIVRRGQWPPSMGMSFDWTGSRGSSSATTGVMTESVTTAAGMEALGITIWPSSLKPPTPLAAGQPKAVPEPRYCSTYPRPAPWNTYGAYLPPYHPPPANDLSLLGSLDGYMNDQKVVDDALDFSSLEADLGIFHGGLVPAEEGPPVVNTMKRPLESDQGLLTPDTDSSRRMSGSSFSLSGTGTPSVDMRDVSETCSHPSDYTRRSLLTVSSTPLFPVPWPGCAPREMGRTGSRSRASPSPRPSARTAPYTLDGGRKRWSTGSHGPSPALRTSPCLYHSTESFPVTPGSVLPSSSPVNAPVVGSTPRFHGGKLPSSPRLLSQGAFRTLQSRVDPPDLLGPLREEQLAPPAEDMSPADPELVPRAQELRFANDLYTPRWVRGHGNKREGWCGTCRPGRWLVLKNSAYWYDKSFTHGVSAATGQAFEGPREMRRMAGTADVWEGLCGRCGEWIALVSSRKRGTTWFRHAYKCHAHQKTKDPPKTAMRD
ncbi:hypothetical protein VTN02DRAFT_4602 [Thermoascus thermophilus]